MNSFSPWILNDKNWNIERFFKKYQRKREIWNPKNQVHCKSAPVSSNDSIIANHRQSSLNGTDHNNSVLSKIIQFERKQSHNYSIFEKICKRIIKKSIFLVYSVPLKVISIFVPFLYSIIFQYLPPLFLHFFVFISYTFS